MSIQNINSTSSASRPTGDSAPVVVPRTQAAPVEVPQAAVTSEPTPAQLQRMVAVANQAMQRISSSLEFSVDEATNKTVIRVVEKQTGQLIMQFPTEDMLSITRAIDNAQQSILLRQKA